MRIALSFGLLAVASPALAQPAGPPPVPTRDFAVSYGEGRGAGQVAWLAAEGRMRADLPNGTYIIWDTKAHRQTMVHPGQRLFFDSAGKRDRSDAPVAVRPGEQATRAGAEKIVGQDCTLWRVAKPDSESDRTICVTADGVTLRAIEREDGEVKSDSRASRVSYDRQDPSRFQVPEGYRRWDPRTEPNAFR